MICYMQRADTTGGGTDNAPAEDRGSPRKGEGRANIRGRSVAGRSLKRFKDVLWESVLDMMRQDEYGKGKEE